jgi:hypothetical protein
MYVNGKMTPVETIALMGRYRRVAEGMNYVYLMYCKNFCKCQKVWPLNTAIKKEIYCIILPVSIMVVRIDLPYYPAIPLPGIYQKDCDSGYYKGPAHQCILQHYSQ